MCMGKNMRIERIDEKTVKCFISNEEMQEYEITYKDFLTRSDKAREIVEEIIEQAEQEVGYEPPKFALDLQIMMMPERGMILTFSEKSPEDLQNAPTFLNYLKEMKKLLEGKGQGGTDGAAAENAAEKTEEKRTLPDFAIFVFESLADVFDYAGILPQNLRIGSSLYRMGEIFYLYMEKGAASYERYSHACVEALEFGQLYGAGEDNRAYLLEHGDCLIGQKALNQLKRMNRGYQG